MAAARGRAGAALCLMLSKFVARGAAIEPGYAAYSGLCSPPSLEMPPLPQGWSWWEEGWQTSHMPHSAAGQEAQTCLMLTRGIKYCLPAHTRTHCPLFLGGFYFLSSFFQAGLMPTLRLGGTWGQVGISPRWTTSDVPARFLQPPPGPWPPQCGCGCFFPICSHRGTPCPVASTWASGPTLWQVPEQTQVRSKPKVEGPGETCARQRSPGFS